MHERTTDESAAAVATIPPVELDTLVPCSPEAAFNYFTRDIARWWPLAEHSCSEGEAAGVAFEGAQGGALVETARDGTRHVWGTVVAWEPGRRLAFTWHPGYGADAATSVEVTFQRAGNATRVRVVHSGWERLGEGAARKRDNYAKGWVGVLTESYRGYCEAS